MWKNRRHNVYVRKLQARDEERRVAAAAEEKIRMKASYRDMYGEAEANKRFPEEGTAKCQATQQHAGDHGVQMQFISSGMPKNVTPQYVTVVTQPHY